MTIGEFLAHNTKHLQNAGIDTARLDVLVLLEDVLERGRANLLAHPEDPVPASKLAILNNYITQREDHVPLAYIRGKAAFYGRDFVVNEHVLVPRPETESMIEIAKKLDLKAPRIIDVGTGSGCIGITAAIELPSAEVTLLDVDENALAVATQNARRLRGAVVHAVKGNLLANYDQPIDLVLANLPYVPEDYPINKAAGKEPALALFAGKDGLDLYRELWGQIAARDDKPTYILTEALISQHKPLTVMAKAAGYNLVQTDGLVQLFVKA